ncbi:DNA ligase D [Ureibacillus sp. NPDC094379]
MKPMLLTPAETVPIGDDWIYETKYDGFRCLLVWEEQIPKLISRNEKELTSYFPEIIEFCSEMYEDIKPFLPIMLDGEIVYLSNDFKSEFSIVQTRGRTKTKHNVKASSEKYPCNLVVFDLLQEKGKDLTQIPLVKRKEKLHYLFEQINLPTTIVGARKGEIQTIDVFKDEQKIWNLVYKNHGEGVIAKRKSSIWESGTRSNQWLKVKNWRFISVILTSYDQVNGYFNGAVYLNKDLVEITIFRHGLSDEELTTLVSFFQTKGNQEAKNIWTLPPSICVDIACIDFDGKKLREPRFHQFRFDLSPNEVTWKGMLKQLHPLPESIQITHPDKPIFPAIDINKDDYLLYLQEIAPQFLPFLKNRLLTNIRFPHGVPGESFYQKNAPDYTPDFVLTKQEEDIHYIVCNDIETLLWLGNQLAIEFHIPFQTIDTNCPTEIVMDLDPPSVEEFSLAVEAAIRMKAIFDSFKLKSFVKTSGGKGLQIYIPLPKNRFTYDDTRIFTEFICKFIIQQEPQWFTIERLKKNRNNKLYLDYIQHAEGKTIISPYSPRGNENGLIATPLNWDEVNDKLTPRQFTIPAVLERIKNKGDPFKDYFNVGEQQDFEPVLTKLKELIK